MTQLKRNSLFNPNGDTDLRLRRMIGGNTTNLNDFNNMKYQWASDWYRQAMNNFWIPEEINLTQDTKDYPRLDKAERTAYDKILSFLLFTSSTCHHINLFRAYEAQLSHSSTSNDLLRI